MSTILGIKSGSENRSETVEVKDGIPHVRITDSIVYEILATNDAMTEDDILNTAGVPAKFALRRGAYCIDRKAVHQSSLWHPVTHVLTNLWRVTCRFDSDVNVDENDETPDARTPHPWWTTETGQEPLEKDAITGKPIQTVPGEPITIMRPVPREVLHVKRYEVPPFDPDVIHNYQHHTNENPFYGAPAGCAWLTSIETAPELEVIETVKYEVVEYQIKFKTPRDEQDNMLADGWMWHQLHEGHLYWPNGRGFLGQKSPEVYSDANGNPATINLDADGAKLGPNDDAVYLDFNQMPKADFDELDLGPY